MYKSFIRPILFWFGPEQIHRLVVFKIRAICRIPGLYRMIRRFTSHASDTGMIHFAGMRFEGRVGLAAGFDKNADFFMEMSVLGFSFVEIGTVTPLPQPGNLKPRLFRLIRDEALINRMGFNNKGVDHAVRQLKKRDGRIIIGGNIGKNTATPNERAADDYAVCFEKLYGTVDYFAVNVSCPNIAGMEKLQDIDELRIILSRIKQIRSEKTQRKPVFLKIAPDLSYSQIDAILDLVRETGMDGIIAANTTTSRAGLSSEPGIIQRAGKGGLSGKPLKERVLEMVRYICKQTGGSLPVIAVGGIMSAEDAMNLVKAGAGLVQVYTGMIYEGPLLIRRINRALSQLPGPDLQTKGPAMMHENVPGRI